MNHKQDCRCVECYIWCDGSISPFGKKYLCQEINGHSGNHLHEASDVMVEWSDEGINMTMKETYKFYKLDMEVL